MEIPTLVSKSVVKPFISTSQHLRGYSLSFLDQVVRHLYMPVILFYQNPANIDDILSRIRTSLSKILVHYYPLAGRRIGTDSVDCNDQGVDFYEAQIDCTSEDVLKNPEPKRMELFCPPGMLFNESFKGSPFIVQFTRFTCGGLAISGSMLHTFGDVGALTGFFSDWAAVSRGERVSPTFLSPVIAAFQKNVGISKVPYKKDNCVVTKSFTFEIEKIAQLKSMAADAGTPAASRVEVVTAFVYHCALAASKAARSGISRPSMLMQTVNLRPKVEPPLQLNSLGNFSWIISILSKDEHDKNFETIIAALTKAAKEFSEKFRNGQTLEGSCSLLYETLVESGKPFRGIVEMLDVYMCTSLCRFPLNKMNFGWGEPVGVGTTSASSLKNTFNLMDSVSKSGGIQVLMWLEETEMAILEKDEYFLSFACSEENSLKSMDTPNSRAKLLARI